MKSAGVMLTVMKELLGLLEYVFKMLGVKRDDGALKVSEAKTWTLRPSAGIFVHCMPYGLKLVGRSCLLWSSWRC